MSPGYSIDLMDINCSFSSSPSDFLSSLFLFIINELSNIQIHPTSHISENSTVNNATPPRTLLWQEKTRAKQVLLGPDYDSNLLLLTKAEYDPEESFPNDDTSSIVDAGAMYGSQDELIPESSTPLAGTLSNIPKFVTSLSNAEQHLIYSLRQLKLRGWDSGDKLAFSMNKTEQEIVNLAFEMCTSEQMTEFERAVLAKVRVWQSSVLPPLSLATHAQRTFINAIRKWRHTQRPEPFIKRLLRK